MSTHTSPKIALFLPSLEGGGAERIMANLANGFAERGIATDLVLVQAKGPYLSQISSKVNVVDLKAPRTLFSLKALLRYIHSSKPTVIISALNYTNLVAVWAKRFARTPVKVLITIHNQLTVPRVEKASNKERLVTSLMRPFFPWADKIIAVSDGVADDAADAIGLKRNTITTVYNPVVSAEMLSKGKENPRHPWLAEGQPPVVLAIGRFYEQKDFPTLLRAFSQARRTRTCRLIILGEGPMRSDLEHLVDELDIKDSVDLPGFVNNPYAYLARAQVFALSSKWEGLPTVLIEALAFGKSIVATNCKSGPEEILMGGKYGRLVPVSDPEAFAQALDDALSQSEKAVDTKAKVHTEAYSRFTMESAVNAYLEAAELSTLKSSTSPS